MDMAFEYRSQFGPIPDTMSWHEVLAGARRVRPFELRERLILADGTLMGQPMASDDGMRQMHRNKLSRLAYPELKR